MNCVTGEEPRWPALTQRQRSQRAVLDRTDAVPKRFGHQGVQPEFGHGLACPGIVLGAAGETMSAQSIGQRRQQGSLTEPSRPFLQVIREKPVSTNRHDPCGRRGDGDRTRGAVDPRGIFGIDVVALRLGDQRVAWGRWRRIGRGEPYVPRGAPCGPDLTSAGEPSCAVRLAANKPASPNR